MRRYVVAGGILAGPVLLTCCGNVLGIPSDSFLRDEPDAGEDVDAAQLPPPPPPPAGCTANQKLCDGACVPNDDPQYGCAGASCTPCSVAFASTLKCEAGRCAAATCTPGHMHCSPKPEDGCDASILSPKTCGSCTTACDTSQVCGPVPGGTIQCLGSCPAGTDNCAGSCVDLQTSVDNCKTCGNKCAGAANADPSCAAGSCGIACRTNYGDCDGNKANGCEPFSVFYKDGDGDGYGITGQTQTGCSPPAGYAKSAGDCEDTEPKAFPGQPLFFGTGYAKGGGGTSYDYDCNGTETEAPGFVHFTSCGPECNEKGVTTTGRSGPGIDPWCGSTKGSACSSGSASGSGTMSASGICTPSITAVPAVTCH